MAFLSSQMMKEPVHVAFVEQKNWLWYTWCHLYCSIYFHNFQTFTLRLKWSPPENWWFLFNLGTEMNRHRLNLQYLALLCIQKMPQWPQSTTTRHRLLTKKFKLSSHRHWGSTLTSHHPLARDTFTVSILAGSFHQSFRGHFYHLDKLF